MPSSIYLYQIRTPPAKDLLLSPLAPARRESPGCRVQPGTASAYHSAWKLQDEGLEEGPLAMPTIGRVEIDQERCKGCERCVAVCPRGLLRLANRPNRQGYHPAEGIEVADQTKGPCTGCATCGIVCPEVAIAVYARSGDGRAAGNQTPSGRGHS